MIIQEIIAAILARHPELSEQQIQEILIQEKERSGGLLGDETLLRLIAARQGVEVTKQMEFSGTLSSGRLFSGLNDVSVEGKIVAVFPARSFNGGEKSGKFANLMIIDEDSILRIVLWNDKAEIVENGELQTGQIVRLLHGYTKNDRYGKVELHLGGKSRIEINENPQISYPGVEKFASKIGEITNTFNNVHLVGMVKEVLGSKTFTKGDGTEGKLMRFTFVDDSAEITVVAWNGKVDALERQLKPKACLYLINGKVKEKESGGFEVHVDSTSFVQVQPVTLQMIKLADLKEGDVVNVEGDVSNIDPVKEVTTGKGEQIKLLTFELEDETGSVRVSAWRNQVEQLSNLKLGDEVTIENGFVKKGYGNKLEISTRSGTQFIVKTI
ncbi:MAG: OB-fold nucleic acid binding domain-containing protein [Candidatus Bathyarchaeota archaeon]|nr:OB-fold nucleic acid binding domain-containing protein [Candidatus Termiticorpusculum sp.]